MVLKLMPSRGASDTFPLLIASAQQSSVLTSLPRCRNPHSNVAPQRLLPDTYRILVVRR